MLLVTGAADLLQVITGAAATDIEVHASYVDNNAGAITPGRTNTASILTAATTTVVASPGAGIQRNVKHLNITNNHASASCSVQVVHTDGTNVVTLMGVTLLAGENLTFDGEGNWNHYTADGGLYGYDKKTYRKVTLADQAIGASVTNYITGSDIDATNLKVGSKLVWEVCVIKSAAATAAHTLDIRFGTAGTTADTSRQSQVTGTQTAVADVAHYRISLVIRAIGATGNFHGFINMAHALNATGFDNARSNVVTEALSANFDLTPAALKAGLSITTGASHALTVKQVTVERTDP